MNVNLRLLYGFIIIKSAILISTENPQNPRRGLNKPRAVKTGIKRTNRHGSGINNAPIGNKRSNNGGLNHMSAENDKYATARTRQMRIKPSKEMNRSSNRNINHDISSIKGSSVKNTVRYNVSDRYRNRMTKNNAAPMGKKNRYSVGRIYGINFDDDDDNNNNNKKIRSIHAHNQMNKKRKKRFASENPESSGSLQNRMKDLAKKGGVKLGKMALSKGLGYAEKMLANETPENDSKDDNDDEEDYESLFKNEGDKKDTKEQKSTSKSNGRDKMEEYDEDFADSYTSEDILNGEDSESEKDQEESEDDEKSDESEEEEEEEDDDEEEEEWEEAEEDNFEAPDEPDEFQDDGIVGNQYKTPSGLEYLGAGYDLIKGNPLGDKLTLLDPGYRSNIIQMHWSKRFEGVSNSLKFLQPLGGWIRPYPSCHKVEMVTEIRSSDSLLKALSADANVSLVLPGDSLKFSASAKFKQLDNVSKSEDRKIYMNRSYCFKYVAGISTSLHWDFTLGFKSVISGLTPHFKGLDENSGCKPSVYLEDSTSDICKSSGVTGWMELFEIFGTHVATKIYLGGKIFSTLEVKKNQEEMFKNSGMDIKAILSSQLKDSGINSTVRVSVLKSDNNEEITLDTKKTTFVIGGDVYNYGKYMSFDKWAETVSDHSMPIKAEYTPIINFLDKSLEKAYNSAYIYYGKLILNSDD
ncbi:MAC/Perforin domain containing protein [Theileria equi strain WA]|uniref:MAC/Perforin domain containing protein n=1 Tax=Theileria equi strain WA TaxID=1537102 RepID=L0ATR8_THEEQ|nr:MAC/Perforin domain containing protein [Theileria equi strain WA]AFZ79042.1 MAC/Perforin domain containing protein [Theileria equi strain WA]|eukprot:XP_004828708.1 MAC/Perforin domain containing protein [Theileria equi strain WA]